jgi:hypothetical protein
MNRPYTEYIPEYSKKVNSTVILGGLSSSSCIGEFCNRHWYDIS